MASSADTVLLEARRQTLLTEISQLVSKPDYSIDGQTVSMAQFRKSLYDELDSINKALAANSGPWEIES